MCKESNPNRWYRNCVATVGEGSPANSIKNWMFVLKTPLGSTLAGAAYRWRVKPVFLNKVDGSVPFGIIQTCRQICSSFTYIIFNLLERLHDVLWNYYCAELKCKAPQRSPINPNLMCIWSPFGRGNRPRLKKQPGFVHKKRLWVHVKDLRGSSSLSALWAHRTIPGTTTHFDPPVSCLLLTDHPGLFSTLLRKRLRGSRMSSPNESLLCKGYKERKAMETLQV